MTKRDTAGKDVGVQRQKNVLVVDDEPGILEGIASYLEAKGYRAFRASTGREALEVFGRENIAVVLLDLMLPDIPGEEVCLSIRRKSRVPVIMLTAKVEDTDMLKGLELGADDYMTKPFSMKELTARMATVLRRAGDDLVPLAVRNSFGDGDLFVDFEKKEFRKKGRPVALTPIETNILSMLIKYPRKVFTREEMIFAVLGDEYDGFDRTIDTHIKNLRQKLEDDPRHPVYIITAHRIGYKFDGA
jgi:DNA-binding response OmpR family regulator